jgi:hypothetical protein
MTGPLMARALKLVSEAGSRVQGSAAKLGRSGLEVSIEPRNHDSVGASCVVVADILKFGFPLVYVAVAVGAACANSMVLHDRRGRDTLRGPAPPLPRNRNMGRQSDLFRGQQRPPLDDDRRTRTDHHHPPLKRLPLAGFISSSRTRHRRRGLRLMRRATAPPSLGDRGQGPTTPALGLACATGHCRTQSALPPQH